ncbi:MAG: pyruvate dehydrogenase (acetyl-transferring) E1 component subunit alpha [Candidatus Nanohaloarchaeota archaeon QJJ-9]|nr:pyruvate dehydrogenase (acetyl-transferring) E1 component subunit alpha [Candidatus Nanohaloarchaeota archaeon QJJ-9]
MPRETKYHGEIEHLQVMDKDGKIDEEEKPAISEGELKEMYWYMILTRKFDEKALKLQRQGKLGTYASSKGQEAAQVGPALAMDEKDWLFPSFREQGAYFVRGKSMIEFIQYWRGDERGTANEDRPENFVISVPVGSQIPHAVGAAWAAKKQGDNVASLVFFGDGATSEGDFHEGMNFAGTFNIPTVFLCQNNQYAISMPRKDQTGSDTLAQKALAYGFEGIQVDGNDVLATYKATKDALEKAREENKPTMIEAVTYRREDHTTADDASRYRDKEEVERWKEKDPIKRLKAYMMEKKIVEKSWFKEKAKEAEEKVEEAVDKADKVEDQDIEDIFQHHYKEMPEEHKKQLEELKSGKRGGK